MPKNTVAYQKKTQQLRFSVVYTHKMPIVGHGGSLVAGSQASQDITYHLAGPSYPPREWVRDEETGKWKAIDIKLP